MWFKFIYLLPLLIVCLHQFQLTIQYEQSSNKGNEYLLVANKTAIYRFGELNLNSSLITHVPTDSKVKSLDYSFKDRLLFWISQLDSSINVNNIDNGRTFKPFRSQTTSPESLAVDWITKKIYWIDIEPYRIEVSDYDGSNNSLVIILSNEIPKCIALAPLNGLIFWNDNEHTTISRISMNGLESTRKTIINSTKAIALTVDHNLKKIFWSDLQSKRIRSADFDGQHQREIIASYTPTITLHHNNIFYSDFVDKLVYSLDIIGRSKKNELIKFDDFVPHLQYFSHLNQPETNSLCHINNGGCSNLCLLSSEPPFYSCACPTGIQLLDDRKTCKIFPNDFLLIAFKFNIKYISLETNHFLPKPTKIKNQDKILSVDFDTLEQRVYWSDKNKIKSAFLNGTDEKLITECDLEYERFKIDVKNRNIYLVKNLLKFTREDETRSSNFSIEVVSLDGRFKKTLIDNLIDRPRALALDEDREFLYFSDWGEMPKIERVSFDLKKRETIVKTEIVWPNGILIDRELNRLYWCDAKLYKIEYLDLDSFKRSHLIKLDGISFLDLTLLGDFIFWSDTTRDQIGRVHKLTGNSEIISNKNQKLGKIMGLNAISLKDRTAIHQDARLTTNCTQLTLSKSTCACTDGYSLDNDNVTCLLGNNTCDLNNGDCEQLCTQLIGNYRKCSCYDGYVLELDQKTCTEKRHEIPVFLPCQASHPCSHDCFQIDNEFHCKCPDKMYLHKDGKNCLPYSKLASNDLKESIAIDQPHSTNTNQSSRSSTLTTVIVCLLAVSLTLVLILISNHAIKKKRKRNNRLDYSKENILDNNKRLIDFGYSLSNVENSILYDRSVAGASSSFNSANKPENQSLTNPPPPSPFSQDNETSFKFDFKFDQDNLRFVSGKEASTANNSETDLIDIDYERKNDKYSNYVPPSTPVNCLFNSPTSLYNEQMNNERKNFKNETDADYSRFLEKDSSFISMNPSNPPNSPSTSMNNLRKI